MICRPYATASARLKFINIEFYEERVRLGMDAEHTAIGVHCAA